jgi:ABC-type transport system involved in cytochrome bd biosynthesis fused ATPase/permease subunit
MALSWSRTLSAYRMGDWAYNYYGMNAFVGAMPWTSEDSKDVFKKVIGGLIAAAVVAIGYAVIEEMEWFYAVSLSAFLLVLVTVLLWWMKKSAEPGEAAPKCTSAPLAQSFSTGERQAGQEHRQVAQEVTRDEPREEETHHKSLKKIAKADQKKRKKEAKAEKKREERIP